MTTRWMIMSDLSEGASLAAAFPHRSISPIGTIGFHQAAINPQGGTFSESDRSDLLQQVRGDNHAMIAHLAQSIGLPDEKIRPWVYDGAVFVGEKAVEAGVAARAVSPSHPRPLEHKILNAAS